VAARPEPVRIELAHPTFPPEIAELRAAVAPLAEQLEFTAESVMSAAAAETGLDDFGEGVAGFTERLVVVMTALDTEAGLGDFGRISCHAQISQHVRNRLLVTDVWRRHPEIEEVEVAAPIIIGGLPRTGTTHLHNLLAADPALRSLPYWESLEPVPPLDEQGSWPWPTQPRSDRCAAGLEVVNTALPYFKRMHEMTTDHVHEEIQLLALDMSTMLFETMAPMPSWRDYYLAHEQTPHYRYVRKVLQTLQWARGGSRWVLKSPQHIEQFPAVLAAFGDATFVVTHRDPVPVTQSMSTMITYASWMALDPIEPERIAGYWSDRIETMLRHCVEQRSVLPDDRTIDVRFDEFMADDVAMIERIYAVADQPFDDGVRAAFDAYMADHPRGRHGAVLHDPEPLGLDLAEREEALAFYRDRFGV
jgi:hypothetical protein